MKAWSKYITIYQLEIHPQILVILLLYVSLQSVNQNDSNERNNYIKFDTKTKRIVRQMKLINYPHTLLRERHLLR